MLLFTLKSHSCMENVCDFYSSYVYIYFMWISWESLHQNGPHVIMECRISFICSQYFGFQFFCSQLSCEHNFKDKSKETVRARHEASFAAIHGVGVLLLLPPAKMYKFISIFFSEAQSWWITESTVNGWICIYIYIVVRSYFVREEYFSASFARTPCYSIRFDYSNLAYAFLIHLWAFHILCEYVQKSYHKHIYRTADPVAVEGMNLK